MSYKNIRKECEELWAKNKYYVLSKSHKEYLGIREYLKGDELDVSFLKDKIQKTKDMNESRKDFSNAVLHVWGYFKEDASAVEKQELFNILNSRLNSRKKVIISTNLDIAHIGNLYTDRTLSRIVGNFQIYDFYGSDLRFR